MQIRIFNIPISDNGEMEAEMRCIELVEMNRFLAASKVLEIEQPITAVSVNAYCKKYPTIVERSEAIYLQVDE
ncbi:MAG TPA: hypothetical protein PLK75_06975 [Bacteroidales bacterium]|nr:hypothetical protein [Bacteroidales bacterium]